MNNKAAVDELINEMIQVLTTEVDITINKSNLIFKHKTDKMTGSLIAKSIGKYGLEWSSDIIRDQVIATLYESMLIVSKDKSIEELRLDNSAFMGPVYTLTEKKIKKELIPKSKEDTDGSIIGYSEEPISPLAEAEESTSRLEDLLNASSREIQERDKAKTSHFLLWFEANKKKILTKKQLQFINNELIDISRASECNIKKRIADRVIKAYEEEYPKLSQRAAALMDKKKTLEEILSEEVLLAKDFRTALLPYINEDYIIDTIMDNVSPEAIRVFNKGFDAQWVVEEYKEALKKCLRSVNAILEQEKAYK